MSILMLLAASGRRDAVTEAFASNRTWTAPAGVTQLDTVLGKGAAGSPGGTSTTTVTQKRTTVINTLFRRDGGPNYQSSSSFDGWSSADGANYCDNTMESDSTVYYGSQKCYFFETYEKTVTTSTPATTGAATTGFGKTFPGGAGGPATPASYSNVAVVPGQSYALTIPSGGSITITYLK